MYSMNSKEIMRNSSFPHSDWIAHQDFLHYFILEHSSKKKTSQGLILASCELINSHKNKFSLHQKSNDPRTSTKKGFFSGPVLDHAERF
jgi:hypothetical protein